MEWKNIYRGMLMGVSETIPGISGGTIAVLVGIYDQLIRSINGLMSRDWKKQLSFLVPLGAGMLLALLLFSRVMTWLLDNYNGATKFFFLGLILGVLPFLFKKADAKKTFQTHHILLLALGAVLVGLLGLSHPEGSDAIAHISPLTYITLFFSGLIASSALILPGMSGSLMFLILGMYDTVMAAVSHLQLNVLAVTGVGVIMGIILMTKIVNHFLTYYYTGTFAVIIGMVIGSVLAVFPGWPADVSAGMLSILTFALGLGAAYLLDKANYE